MGECLQTAKECTQLITIQQLTVTKQGETTKLLSSSGKNKSLNLTIVGSMNTPNYCFKDAMLDMIGLNDLQQWWVFIKLT